MDLENFKYNLKQLKKCNQYWDEMLPNEGGRLCNKCEKTIVDFSDMSFTDIAIFIAKSKKPVCGFYLPEQLEASKKISANLPLVVGLSSTIATALLANPEMKVRPIRPEINISSLNHSKFEIQKIESSYQPDSLLLSGKVQSFDSVTKAYLLVSYVSVMVKESRSDVIIEGTVTKDDGSFTLHFLPADNSSTFSLVISSIGFETKEIKISYNKQQQIDFGNITLEKYKTEISTFYVSVKKRSKLNKIWRSITKPFQKQ